MSNKKVVVITNADTTIGTDIAIRMVASGVEVIGFIQDSPNPSNNEKFLEDAGVHLIRVLNRTGSFQNDKSKLEFKLAQLNLPPSIDGLIVIPRFRTTPRYFIDQDAHFEETVRDSVSKLYSTVELMKDKMVQGSESFILMYTVNLKLQKEEERDISVSYNVFNSTPTMVFDRIAELNKGAGFKTKFFRHTELVGSIAMFSLAMSTHGYAPESGSSYYSFGVKLLMHQDSEIRKLLSN